MTHKQQIVKTARLQGKTAKECSALSGLSLSYCRHLIAGTKGQVKNEIIKTRRDIEAKTRLLTVETRESLIVDLRGIADACREDKPGIAIKAIDHIGRMIGAYGEDNKQRGAGSIGGMLAELVKTRTALAAAQATDRLLCGTKAVDSEIIDQQASDRPVTAIPGPPDERAGAEGETGVVC